MLGSAIAYRTVESRSGCFFGLAIAICISITAIHLSFLMISKLDTAIGMVCDAGRVGGSDQLMSVLWNGEKMRGLWCPPVVPIASPKVRFVYRKTVAFNLGTSFWVTYKSANVLENWRIQAETSFWVTCNCVFL